jgi:hypothetical protein
MQHLTRTAIASVVALGILGAQPAFAAKAAPAAKAKPAAKEEPPPPPPPPPPAPREDQPPPPQEEQPPPEHISKGGQLKTDSNKPSDFGSGYYSWGTRGGATLGQGNGARAQINFGYPGTIGSGWAGLEGAYYFNLGEDFDLGIAARLPFYPFGLAPGGHIRYRVMKAGAFQLAIDGAVYLPLTFANYLGFGFALGVSLEPGAMASYFVKDNMEIYFGLILPLGFQFFPGFGYTVGFDIRGGFAYTLKKSNIGFFANIDFVPGFGSFSPLAVILGTGPFFGFNFSAGAQFRF